MAKDYEAQKALIFDMLSSEGKAVAEQICEETKQVIIESRRHAEQVDELLLAARDRANKTESIDDCVIRLLTEWLEGVTRETLGKGLFSLAIFRAISKRFSDPPKSNIQREFWVANSDNALQMFVLEWCKVFGSEKNNNTYFTKTVSEETFFGCLDRKGISKEQFKAFSFDMCTFRDKFIAHEDWYHRPIPLMEGAVNVIDAYEDALMEKYDGIFIVEQPLLAAYRQYIRDIEEYLNQIKVRDI